MISKILVVDDEPDILEILRELLSGEGYGVVTASTAEEFHRLALREKFALLILDIMIKDVNGVLLYDSLLAQGLDRNIPVIFLSGLVDQKTTAPITPGHHYAMHPKPFACEILLQDIRALIQNAA